MLRRINWLVLLGVVFIALGIVAVFIGDWLNAAYGVVAGVGAFGINYGQKHPKRARSPLAWILSISWIVAFAVLTILRFRTR